jgi:2-desacetyl-2-hydroxyethyl bacteriochlorophyllide A dehydrogenase
LKALLYLGPKTAAIRDVAEPEPKEGQVRLNIRYCGICGSDIGIYLGTHPRAKAPLVLGHEFLGEIAEDGRTFRKGDRVTAYPLLSCGTCLPCRTGNAHVCDTLGLIGIDIDGGACGTICVDEDVLFKVPDDVSDKAAAVTEPLAVIVRAIHQSRLKALDTALVTGAGPIGFLTGLMLRHMGASKVMISDVNKNRLSRAESLGMIPVDASKDVLKFTREATHGVGVDILYECSGAESVALQMTDLVRVGGTICMVAQHKVPHEVNLRDLNYKEQMMIGTRVYTKEEFRLAVGYAAAIREELETVVSHMLPLEDSPRVFDMIADPGSGTVKVLIDCQ